MKKKKNKNRTDKRIILLLSIIFVFCILGSVVFSVSRKVSREMSTAAIQNLNENLDLIKCIIESVCKKEAEFQKLIAEEIATRENVEDYIRSYQKNQTMVKISLIRAGETKGVSNTEESFSEEGMRFTTSEMMDEIEISNSYLNYMGTWAYTLKCPVIKNNQRIGALYIEYTYDTFDELLPDGFYNKQALLYIMDVKTERFVLKPKGMGQRSAGHLNLEDFYRANNIYENEILAEIEKCVQDKSNIMFYHDIRGKSSLNFIWMSCIITPSFVLWSYTLMENCEKFVRKD